MFPSARFERKRLLLFLVNLWILQDYTRTISASKLQESDEVRIAHSLHKKEVEFVDQRREIIFQSLKKLEIHCSKDEMPNIALLGSGGGQRAMVGLLGSLVQLDKAGLLDCILYLSGVSGSTWCMASLYQEPDWSTKLETVKDKIIKRLNGSKVSQRDANKKMIKYYSEKKDLFTLTDVWAAMAVTTFVKEIDERKFSDQWDHLSKDPFPIYTVIDKQCKQCKEEKDPWFEISPYDAGYSLTGAFVGTPSFGSQFDNGSKKKQPDIDMPEMDMLYLQALCGSALGDEEENLNFLWEKIKGFFPFLLSIKQSEMSEEMREVPNSPPIEKCYQVLMDLADMNLAVLNGKDPSALDQSIRTTLSEVSGNKSQLSFLNEQLNLTDKAAAQLYMKQYTEDVCNNLNLRFSFWPDVKMWCYIYNLMHNNIWGRNYHFLYNMTEETVPLALLENETRDYIDAGVLLNSPYFSVLRKERNIDLIISLDFSEGDPFLTVTKTAEMCDRLNISFPDVQNFTEEVKNKPKDFYVFEGQNAPTVIHIPLFNVVNCGDDIETWRKEYTTAQLSSYSAEMITKLMEVAGKNISNNREKLLEQIKAVIEKKRHG